MKTLFDKNFKYTLSGTDVFTHVCSVLDSLFDGLVNMGYSPRELAVILHHAVTDSECKAVLNYRKKDNE